MGRGSVVVLGAFLSGALAVVGCNPQKSSGSAPGPSTTAAATTVAPAATAPPETSAVPVPSIAPLSTHPGAGPGPVRPAGSGGHGASSPDGGAAPWTVPTGFPT